MLTEYTVLIEQDEEGWLVGSVPSLHGCHTQASTMGELLERMDEVIRLCLEVQERDGGEDCMYAVTATQKGAIGESIVAIQLILESGGRLSPFEPLADDDGIDLLIYDKETGTLCPSSSKDKDRYRQASVPI